MFYLPNYRFVVGKFFLYYGMIFYSSDEVTVAYDNRVVGLHARIKVKIDGNFIETAPHQQCNPNGKSGDQKHGAGGVK